MVVLMLYLMKYVLLIVFIQLLIKDVVLFIARSYFFYFESTAYSTGLPLAKWWFILIKSCL